MLASAESSASQETGSVRHLGAEFSAENKNDIIALFYIEACEELRDAEIALATANARYKCESEKIATYKWLLECRTVEQTKPDGSPSSGEAKPSC
jgi:hypothetical protein